MSEGVVRATREGPVATVWFDRPEARNALTAKMYSEFTAICEELGGDASLRAIVLRGVGGKAFIAGTDIARFKDFISGDDGVAYEREMETYLAPLLAIPVPTIAVVEGYAVGGGLNIAAGCDLRIATTDSRFGTPIAKTIGNMVSMKNYARLLMAFGESRAKRMLLLGELLSAEEAQAAGFLARMVAPEALDGAVTEVVDTVLANAPLTLRANKEAIRRIRDAQVPDGDDLIRMIYGSRDFKEGVRAFFDKTKPEWRGE
jgi:enoyl-CoA hydratase